MIFADKEVKFNLHSLIKRKKERKRKLIRNLLSSDNINLFVADHILLGVTK